MDFSPEHYLKIGPYLEVFQGVRTALEINEGIIKVVGVPGSGKSSLCELLVTTLEAEHQQVIYFKTPPESADELFQHIQNILGLNKNKDFNRALTHYLQEVSPTNKLIIIYNDAEKISKELFILIRLLNNIHDDSKTLVSQIITGTNQLDRLFDDPALRSLTQYLNQSFTLSPMSRTDLDDFYSSYRHLNGFTSKGLSNKELTDLFIVSKGLPGKTLQILDDYFTPAVTEPEEETPQDLIQDMFPDATPALDPALPRESNPEQSTEARGENLSGTTAVTNELTNSNLNTSQGPDQNMNGEEVLLPDSLEDVLLPELDTDAPSVTEISSLELNQLLSQRVQRKREVKPAYFKIGLSVLVIITTMVLGMVLSGSNDTVNDKLVEILAVDAPLYLDEVSEVSTDNVQDETQTGQEILITDIGETSGLVQEPAVETLALVEFSKPLETIPASDNAIDTEKNSEELNEDQSNINEADAVSDISPATNTGINSGNTAPVFEDTLTRAEPEPVSPPDAQETTVSNDRQTINVSDSIKVAITDWLDDWQQGNFDAYLNAYHEAFIPSYHESYDLWRTQRADRIDGVQGITVDYDRFEILSESENQVMVSFWLQYSRGNYADETLKEILFVHDEDQWLIQSERNIEVINFYD